MRNKRSGLIFFSIILVLLCVYVKHQENKGIDRFFIVEIEKNQETETISLWRKTEEDIYVFLPSYAEMASVRILMKEPVYATMDGKQMAEQTNCGKYQLNTPYEMVYKVSGEDRKCTITFVRSKNVPTIYINVESNNMEYIHAEKGREEAGTIRAYAISGEKEFIGEIKEIKGRGNTTWGSYEKKPYSLELAQETNLLGMGAAKEWILLANAADASHVRNKMVFELAKQTGLKYSPESCWIDLYLNGEYTGLYLLCERNEVHPERINIDSKYGALVSLELEERLDNQRNDYVVTNRNQALRIHAPNNANEEEKEKVLSTFQSIENALCVERGIDPVSGKHWNELLDVDSWARKYLVEEIFANYDACFISQFFYFDPKTNGKVYAGPVWDFDLSMGSTMYWPYATPQEYYGYRLDVQDGEQRPWFYMLYQQNEFKQLVEELFQYEFLPKVEEMLSNGLEAAMIKLKQAAKMNQTRWSLDNSIEVGVDEIREYMEKRMAFLQEVWVDKREYRILQVNPVIAHYVYYAVKPGNCFTELPELGDTADQSFFGWYYEGTDEPFDPTRPIYEDTAVYAKWEDTPYKKLEQVKKLLPAGIIAIMFLAIFAADVRRMRKGG